MRIITVDDVCRLLKDEGILRFIHCLIRQMEADFARWENFHNSPRLATHFPHGVMEVMPCSDDEYFAAKLVNGHPANPQQGKQTVVAVGVLSRVEDGYPLLLSEMTLLTALRTAAVGALAAKYLARPESRCLSLIGCGAQAEFQVLAFRSLFPIQQVRLFDIDKEAMAKCRRNLSEELPEIVLCQSLDEVLVNSDIVVTATAAKQHKVLFAAEQIKPGTHIQAIGGDCPGKTECDAALLKQAKVVVEYTPQSLLEGELQQLDHPEPYAELWQLIQHIKPGRENPEEITLFDSVGYALEDYSVLRLIYELSGKSGIGMDLPLVPSLKDPKDLFGLLNH